MSDSKQPPYLAISIIRLRISDNDVGEHRLSRRGARWLDLFPGKGSMVIGNRKRRQGHEPGGVFQVFAADLVESVERRMMPLICWRAVL